MGRGGSYCNHYTVQGCAAGLQGCGQVACCIMLWGKAHRQDLEWQARWPDRQRSSSSGVGLAGWELPSSFVVPSFCVLIGQGVIPWGLLTREHSSEVPITSFGASASTCRHTGVRLVALKPLCREEGARHPAASRAVPGKPGDMLREEGVSSSALSRAVFGEVPQASLSSTGGLQGDCGLVKYSSPHRSTVSALGFSCSPARLGPWPLPGHTSLEEPLYSESGCKTGHVLR